MAQSSSILTEISTTFEIPITILKSATATNGQMVTPIIRPTTATTSLMGTSIITPITATTLSSKTITTPLVVEEMEENEEVEEQPEEEDPEEEAQAVTQILTELNASSTTTTLMVPASSTNTTIINQLTKPNTIATTTTTTTTTTSTISTNDSLKPNTSSGNRVAFSLQSPLQAATLFNFHSIQIDEELLQVAEEESLMKQIQEMNNENGMVLLAFTLPKDTLNLINSIEHLIVNVLIELFKSGNAKIRILNRRKWQNFFIDDLGIMRIRTLEPLIYETLDYKRKRGNYRFTLMLYTLAEIHKMLLVKGSTSNREMYYRNPILIGTQPTIDSSIQDVCFLFHKPSSSFGIYPSAKGLIAGDFRIYLTNGNIIECQDQDCAVLLSSDVTSIQQIVTSAKYVLLVEKETIFRKLLSLKILSKYQLILVTGKGYPDVTTRYMIHYFSVYCHLPVYALFDADPFGIEIMLIYRHGSRSMAFDGHNLACPQLLWLGVHPSEINVLNIPTLPLKPTDYKRISSLMQRSYLSQAIRHELSILLNLQRKAQIEAVLESLVHDYIPNKVNRNLII